MGSFSFPRSERILKRPDFVNLNQSGDRYHTEHFIVILKQNGLGNTRLGVTVSKRTGNAVKRSRVKRLIREFFRLNKTHLPQGYDIGVIAKKDASYLDLWKIEEELGKVVCNKKLGV